MSNTLHIHTERVEWLFDAGRNTSRSVFWQFSVGDEDELWIVDIKGKRQADALRKRGASAIIEHCLNDGGNVYDLIHAHCNNEKGIYVDGDYIEPEELIEILRKCGEE